MRKLNAYLGYFMALIFMIHGVEESLVMQGIIPHNEAQKHGGICLMVLVLIHIILTMILVYQNKKVNYLKPSIFQENGSTYIQRYTGIAVLVLALIHGIGNHMAAGESIIYIFRQWPVIHFIAEALMVIMVVVHLNISLEKAAVTLGWIRSVKSRKMIKGITTGLMTASGLFALYGFVCNYLLR